MKLNNANNIQEIFDRHFTLVCPHCGAKTGLTAVSYPRFEYVHRFQLKKVGIVYRCDACEDPIFLKFRVAHLVDHLLELDERYEEVERPKESFEFQYLPTAVANDFKEALTCYSSGCLNAFAAMCRRTVQSASMELGSKGTSKVKTQIEELRGMGAIDDEGFDQLKQIILDGHDGAHPHLPALSYQRAGVLLELMKDVLYQLFVRQAKVKQAAELRVKASRS